MNSSSTPRLGVLWTALPLLALGCLRTPDRYVKTSLDQTAPPPAVFALEGKPFCFSGTNNYYLSYKPRPMVDALLESAAAMELKVVRTWGFIDRGSLDGSVPVLEGEGHKDGVYFQYWDPAKKAPAYNDGPDGLEHLDYAIAKAGQVGVKLMIVLTNNWRDFGGMDQYLVWYGLQQHHQFYTDTRVFEAYKAWAQHLITRKNTVTGVVYRDDPTIFGWELANEPRCKSGRNFDTSAGWSTSTLTEWVNETSAYVKSIDPNHLVSVGDEGFLNGGGDHWTYKANDGVDHAELLRVPGIDFGTFHMYPEDWGTGPTWGDHWILDHLEAARRANKPTLLEEYGFKVTRDGKQLVTAGLEERERLYRRWNEIMLRKDGAAVLFWMLADKEHGDQLYPDYDHYTIYRGRDSAALLQDVAERFPSQASACVKAQKDWPHVEPSKFVSVVRAFGAERVASREQVE